VNALFCETSGYGREELIGRPHNIIRSGVHSKEFFSGYVGNAQTRRSLARRSLQPRKETASSIGSIHSSCRFSTIPAVAAIFRCVYDITSLKQIQATVDGQNNLIEKKRQRLAEIAFMLAHDLRAPLANILGITEALQNGTLNAEQSARMIQAIRTEAERSDVILHRMMQNAVESGALGPV
jgi:signal transduction histidine kinase